MKRYFWLKLHTDFFKSDDIKVIQSEENGDKYVIFYLKLLLLAIKQQEPGVLRYKEKIPYSPRVLAGITDTDIDVVRSSLKILIELGMIEMHDDDILVQQAIKLIGSETDAARRMRKMRQRKKANLGRNKVTKRKEIRDQSIEIKDKKEDCFFFGLFDLTENNTTLSLRDKLQTEKKYREDYLKYVADICKSSGEFVNRLSEDTEWDRWADEKDFENRSWKPQKAG